MADGAGFEVDTIIDWLVHRVAEELKCPADTVPLDETFFDLGLNSLNTLLISGELGEFLGHPESNPSLFWDYPTIQKLADHLVAQPQAIAGA